MGSARTFACRVHTHVNALPSVGRSACATMLLICCLQAQDFTQRGFIQTGLTLYPETAPNDSGHAVGDALFRYEASYKVRPWLRISAALRCRIRYP